MDRTRDLPKALPRRSPAWLIIWILLATPILLVGCSTRQSSSAATSTPESEPSTGQTRTYYIAADGVDWDYAPSNLDQITGQPFGDAANVFVQGGEDRIGKLYRKSVYHEYTDQTFSTRKEVDPKWEHLGLLGPVIHAEVGDMIEVVFKNHTRFPASVHSHGVFYQKDAEGAPYNDGTSDAEKNDDAVPPGETYTYHWDVPERAGPGPHDPSSVFWMYHSHVDEVTDTYAGLVGPLS